MQYPFVLEEFQKKEEKWGRTRVEDSTIEIISSEWKIQVLRSKEYPKYQASWIKMSLYLDIIMKTELKGRKRVQKAQRKKCSYKG